MEDRDRRVPGSLRGLVAQQLVGAQVARRKVIVVVGRVGAQMDTRERVVRDQAGDVRPRGDRLAVGARLGLGERKRARAGLLAFRGPLDREVAVQVKPFERRRDLDL